MGTFNFGLEAGLVLAGLLLFLPAWFWARRRRRMVREIETGAMPEAAPAVPGEEAIRESGRRGRTEARLAAIETLQADLAARIDALVSEQNAPEERLQAVASQLLSLIRDKNATFETALAGLDQLRARLRALEQVGELAESRGLIDGLTARLDEMQSTHAAAAAAVERRMAMLEAPAVNPFAEISEQLTRLYTQKDDAIEALLDRLGPIERRLSEIEGRRPGRDAVLARLEAQLAALQEDQVEAGGTLAELQSGLGGVAALGDAFAALRAEKTQMIERIAGRVEAVEQDMIQMSPQGLLASFTERLESLRALHAASETALKDRIAALENPAANPFAEISEQLTALYAQKDATVETMLARLGPLEARLSGIERGLTTRLDAMDWGQNEIAARLAPMETKLAGIGEGPSVAETRAALERVSERLEALRLAHAAGEAATAERLAALENPDANPFAEISDQLTALYAQKDATVETVFARLAPLEEKLAEVMQTLAAQNPQGMLDRFAERLDALRAAHAASETALRDRIAALEDPAANPFAEISDQLTALYAQKDATAEMVLSRLAPLEAKLAEMERSLPELDPDARLASLDERLEALGRRHSSGDAALRGQIEQLADTQMDMRSDFAALRAETVSVDIIAERLEGLHAQKDALSQALLNRMMHLEQEVMARDPEAALERFAERLETLRAAHAASETALRDRLAALENPGANPFAEISEQLTALYAQKDATTQTMLSRLAPLEAKLAEMERSLTARLDTLDWSQDEVTSRLAPLEAKLDSLEETLTAQDPQGMLNRFAERLDALRATHAASETALKDRLAALENPGANPFAEISDQLTALYAQKDATVETVFARLAPLEAKLDSLEETLTAQDPQGMLDRFAERLDALRAAHAASETALKDRLAALENPGANPFAEISDQLTALYAQKDATVETVFARLAPLEEKLSGVESSLSARLDTLDWSQDEVADRLTAVRAGAEEFALKAVTARLAPLQDRLTEIGEAVAAQNPQAMLDRFAERLEALRAANAASESVLKDRLAALENPGANPFAEISDQLTALYAQKDATVETVFARLAPMEARLADMERGISARLDALDWAQGEVAEQLTGIRATAEKAAPAAGMAEELARALARSDASLEAAIARLAPLEARLEALEARPWDPDADEAREQARAVAMQLIALHAAAEQTGLFADRLALLEASLPRLSATQMQLMETLAARGNDRSEAPAADGTGQGGDMEEVWSLPQLVSLHRK